MSLVVNTNVASMNAQRSLMTSGRELQTAMERLSTGQKINSAADDAAGFAIAESMTAQIRGLSMAAKNASDALGLLKVVENATNDVTDMLQRIRELAVQAFLFLLRGYTEPPVHLVDPIAGLVVVDDAVAFSAHCHRMPPIVERRVRLSATAALFDAFGKRDVEPQPDTQHDLVDVCHMYHIFTA